MVGTYCFTIYIDAFESTMISSIRGAISSSKEGNKERVATNKETIIGLSQVIGWTIDNVDLLKLINEEVNENVITRS